MSTPHHQQERGARGSDAALPRLSLGLGLGLGLGLEPDTRRTALVPVLDVRLFRKGLG